MTINKTCRTVKDPWKQRRGATFARSTNATASLSRSWFLFLLAVTTEGVIMEASLCHARVDTFCAIMSSVLTEVIVVSERFIVQPTRPETLQGRGHPALARTGDCDWWER